CGFDGNVNEGQGDPGRRDGSGGVIAGSDGKGRVRTLAGSALGATGDGPLSPSHIEIRMVVEGGQGQELEIPGYRGPSFEVTMKLVLEECLYSDIGERARFQARKRGRRRQRLGIKSRAADQSYQGRHGESFGELPPPGLDIA